MGQDEDEDEEKDETAKSEGKGGAMEIGMKKALMI